MEYPTYLYKDGMLSSVAADARLVSNDEEAAAAAKDGFKPFTQVHASAFATGETSSQAADAASFEAASAVSNDEEVEEPVVKGKRK